VNAHELMAASPDAFPLPPNIQLAILFICLAFIAAAVLLIGDMFAQSSDDTPFY
jgi:hypothetical protein